MKVSIPPLRLSGSDLTISEFARAARDPRVRVECDDAALQRVVAGWERTQEIGRQYAANPDDPSKRVYGVTTGFGEFKDKFVAPEKLMELQRNILLSHAVGVGESPDAEDPRNYYSGEFVRGALMLRLNTFLRGHSGVSPELVRAIQSMLNLGVIPRVPLRGSVGSSGDLCPLCHTFIVLLGEGYYYVSRAPSDLSVRSRPWLPGSGAPAEIRYAPRWKEGLALSNGAAYSAAMLALAVYDGERLAQSADVAAALSLEGMCGRTRAFFDKIHENRGMRGQIDCAANIRNLVRGSQLTDKARSVQDPYSLRCAPQVHGASRDALAYARMVAEAELNAVTDNPLFFEHHEGAFSQGNFHGQPLALAADFLAIGFAEFASISERRAQLLLDAGHNRNLPANLTPNAGVNSGFMIAQYTAASLVSENKVLAHPASVDSIPTSANSEDHNAMATIAARKLLAVLNNAQATIAIELLVAAQAVEWRATLRADPNGHPLASATWELAEREAVEFERATRESARGAIASQLGAGTRGAYLCIRGAVPTMTRDRVLSDDVERVQNLVRTGAIGDAATASMGEPLRPVAPLNYYK
jgi:histidine ammonia-lyase